MKVSVHRYGRSGYAALITVLSTGVLLSSMMIFAYRGAMRSHAAQADVQLYVDYSEKEDAILRSIVATVPNRAIQVMKENPDAEDAERLSWKGIFEEALQQAQVLRSGNGEGLSGNTGDIHVGEGGFDLGEPGGLFGSLHGGGGGGRNWVTPGVVSSVWNPGGQRLGYPPLLAWKSGIPQNQMMRDSDYPVVSLSKVYPDADESPFRVLDYPEINFGYFFEDDGQRRFVAKRNWWAFEMDLGARDRGVTRVARFGRKFVISIYEVPSQLAISAAAFMRLDGEGWDTATIEGGIFAGRAEGDRGAGRLSLRRGSDDGGQVMVSSESGRVAFVPISRGAAFFDRFQEDNPIRQARAISPTTWDEYSMGALQCAMRADIIDVDEADTPTAIRFSYLTSGGTRESADFDIADQGPSFPLGVEETILGDQRVGLVVMPEKLPAFLSELGAAPTTINHSLAVNIDYPAMGDAYRMDWMGGEAGRIGLVMRQCKNLSAFTSGFSLVSNLRLYIDDDFNLEPRQGGTEPPPCSLFAPEKRYGATEVPRGVEFTGQLGSLKDERFQGEQAINPLASQSASGEKVNIEVNLSPLRRVEDLPPVMMMNWLVILEEVRE